MPVPLPRGLSPPVRLALAYAPGVARAAVAAVFALDQRLGLVMRSVKEPLLGQVRLAWWRERLAELPQTPAGEPLLAALAAAGLTAGDTLPLVDGWEAALLAGDPVQAATALAAARGAAFAALAVVLGHDGYADQAEAAGARWALADLACHASDPELRSAAYQQLQTARGKRHRFPRHLRSLAVLDGWATAIAFKPLDQLHPNWKDLVVIVRIGLFG